MNVSLDVAHACVIRLTCVRVFDVLMYQQYSYTAIRQYTYTFIDVGELVGFTIFR